MSRIYQQSQFGMHIDYQSQFPFEFVISVGLFDVAGRQYKLVIHEYRIMEHWFWKY